MATDLEASGICSLLGNEFVKIKVGEGTNQKEFYIHKKLICSKSVVFDKMFNGGFKEAKSNSATLPEDGPEEFASFVNWLYTGELLHIPLTGEAISIYRLLLGLIYFSEKYSISEVLDRSITAIIWYYETKNRVIRQSDATNSYINCAKGSKWRAFVARVIVYNWTNFPSPGKNDFTSNSKLYDMLSSNNDLLRDVISWGSNKQGAVDPRTLPKCEFHGHPKADVCPYAKYGKEIDGVFVV